MSALIYLKKTPPWAVKKRLSSHKDFSPIFYNFFCKKDFKFCAQSLNFKWKTFGLLIEIYAVFIVLRFLKSAPKTIKFFFQENQELVRSISDPCFSFTRGHIKMYAHVHSKLEAHLRGCFRLYFSSCWYTAHTSPLIVYSVYFFEHRILQLPWTIDNGKYRAHT